jgi:Sec-independent protein translocase protein TatA
MKMNEILAEANFEITPQQRKLADFGRILMSQAVSTKDDALSNTMSRVGSALTDFGTLFGPKNLADVVKKAGVSPEVIKKLLAYADNIQSQQSALTKDHKQGGLDDTDQSDTDPDEFVDPSADEKTAMQADKYAARAKRK